MAMQARAAGAEPPFDYPERVRGLNLFAADRNLRRLLERRAPALMARFGGHLEEFGAWAGGPLDEQAEYSDRHAPPRLESHGPDGEATGRVILNPAYRACHAEAYRRGVIGFAFGKEPAPHLLSFAMGYLLSEADISIHCPVTMTGAVAYVLDRLAPAKVRDRYLPELTRMDGKALSGGTWATELHGGSDVGATTTTAVPDGEAWRLTGLKWFTSNAGAGLALATARPEAAESGNKGLGLYLVPSTLPEGAENRVVNRRLKEKLGTRGLPTAEAALDKAWAVEVAPPPEGLKAMMEALEYSRIHNAVGAAGLHRRAVLEAACWATHRVAFGRPIADYPLVRDALLDLAMEQEASAALAFEAALAFDTTLDDEGERPWLRTATALAKFHTAEQAVRAAARAVELVGGNGYTEEWPTARLYRDALVTAVWEGPANIQALELLRAVAARLPGDAAFSVRVGGILSALPDGIGAPATLLRNALEECRAGLSHLRANPADGPFLARRLMERMADTLALGLLLEEAGADLAAGDRRKALIAKRFAASRFGGRPPKR
ncbi:MAG: acyl-CoA dehydrogenase, partial [Inquilinus sp.]|nr:acyl-CoA dehydrogenase [Inquilinus sp.]